MIKITNGNDTKIVTKGMFENLYSGMGYKIVGDKKELKQVEKPVEVKKEEEKVVPTKERTSSSK